MQKEKQKTMEAMETKTQAQLEELLGTIVEFMKQKDPGLSGMLDLHCALSA